MPEARKAKSGGWGFWERQQASPPHQLRGLGERYKLPSGVRDGAQEK